MLNMLLISGCKPDDVLLNAVVSVFVFVFYMHRLKLGDKS